MKKIISIILTLIITILPCTAFAANTQIPEENVLCSFNKDTNGLLAAEDGSLYIADGWNKVVWKQSGNDLSVFAGVIAPETLNGEPAGDILDAECGHARFKSPWGLAEYDGGILVTDTANHALRYIKDGKVSTIFYSTDEGALVSPKGIAVNGKDIYVTDCAKGTILKFSGINNSEPTVFVKGLKEPSGICIYDEKIYVAETGADCIKSIELSFKQQTVAAGTSEGYADGPVKIASFRAPMDVAADKDGNLYVSDAVNGALRKVSTDGIVSTVVSSNSDSPYPVSPSGLAVSGDTLYMTDAFNGLVFKLSIGSNASYKDVEPSAWYSSYAYRVTELGLMQGTAEGIFSGKTSVTRAMAVQILMNLELMQDRDLIIPEGTSTFTDVPSDAWFAKAVNWAKENGITEGKSDTLFAPNETITRQDLAVMLMRYLKAEAATGSSLENFEDASDAASYAVSALNWAAGNKIINGVSDTALAPKGTATRAQLAAMLTRIINTL